jgi:hypothetical protein
MGETIVRAAPRHFVLAGAVVAAAIAGALVRFDAVWGTSPSLDAGAQPGGIAGALLIVAASVLVHEGLHALVWRALGRLPADAVTLKPTWRGLGLAAEVRRPVSMSIHRVALLAPAIVLGAGTLIAAFGSGSSRLLLWGCFLLFESFADVAVLIATLRVSGSARVLSTPGAFGCVVSDP